MNRDPYRLRKQIDKIDRGDFRPVPAVHPPAPPPPSPTFDVVPVERLTQRTDRFRCVPYRAVLTAGTCADRQAARTLNRGTGSTRPEFDSCRGCTLGAELVARLARVGAL